MPRDTGIEDFEAAIRTVSEPIWEKPISEISFGHFLLRLFQTARRFNMEDAAAAGAAAEDPAQHPRVLGRMLCQLDLWSTAKPFMERWMSEQVGPRLHPAAARTLCRRSPNLPELPLLVHRVLRKAVDGQLKISGSRNNWNRSATRIRSGSTGRATTLAAVR